MRVKMAWALVLAGLPALLFADGRILPIPEKPEDRPVPFAVRYHDVAVSIENGIARITVDQSFINPNAFPVSGEYIFPVPEGAAVDALSVEVDGKALEARLMPAEEARKFFQEQVRRTREVSLLEYLNLRTFRLSLGSFAAGAERIVRVSYTHPVPKDQGLFRFVYPLATERFSSKPLERCRIAVQLKADSPLKNVYSPSHSISSARKSPTEMEIRYEARGVLPDKDFILYYASDEKEIGASLLTWKRPGEEEGWFMLLVSPAMSRAPKRQPKDVVFVIDTSGSMQGEKIEQARGALRHCVDLLKDDDRFNIIAFHSVVSPLFDGLEPATAANRARAREMASSLVANGGTNIHDALVSAVRMFDRDDRPRYVIFLTDGLPTQGPVRDVDGIARAVREANVRSARVFCFGVGYDVNTVLLNLLAQENRALADYIEPGENLEDRVSSFASKISDPVLADPRIEVEGIEIHDIYPKPLPDLFAGTRLIAYGRYRGEGEGLLRVRGRSDGKDVEIPVPARFAGDMTPHTFIPQLWAIAKVGYLLDQIRMHGENRELKEEIARLSTEYGIVTPYTGWVVGEELRDKARSASEALRRAQVAQGFGGGQQPPEATGRPGVRAAKAMAQMKQGLERAEELKGENDEAAREVVKRVHDKTFYRDGKRWVDASYRKDQPTTKIKFDSDEYWKLLSDKPVLGRYQALGASMIVVLDGQAYEIEE